MRRMLQTGGRRQHVVRTETRRAFLESLESRLLMTGTLAADAINALPVEYGTRVSVPAGRTLILPITSESSGPVSYTATAPSGWKVTVRDASNSVFIKFHVSYGAAGTEGDIVLQLFTDIAPNTVQVITNFVNQGKYDGTPFQRVMSDFIVQGGDFGDGSDPDTVGDGLDDTGLNFSDEFSTSAIFSGNGQLAMANQGKDTNGSQFFMTYWNPENTGAAAPRFLDFNHTIFGQVVRGMDVLKAINEVPKVAVQSGQPSVPVDDVMLMSAEVVTNITDTTITIKAPAKLTGTVNLKVTATGEDGTTAVRTIQARAIGNPAKAPPILGNVHAQYAAPGQPITFKLSSVDIDGGAVQYAVFAAPAPYDQPPAGVTGKVVGSTITIYPPDEAYTGSFSVQVGVRQSNATSRGSTLNPWDTQIITLTWSNDATAPTVEASLSPVYGSAGTYAKFTVTYTSDKQISINSIVNNHDAVSVTGPKGYARFARAIAVTESADGKSATVTYRIVAPGGSWNATDAGTYAVTVNAGQIRDAVGNAVAAGGLGTFFYSPTVAFDEAFYLAANPDVAAAVQAGTYASGYAQFILAGQFDGSAPSIFYSDAFYFAANPSAAAAVEAGTCPSGFHHFTKVGMSKGLSGSSYFDEQQYRALHPEVLPLIRSRKFASGLDHFVRVGESAGLDPSLLFSFETYAANNAGAVAAVSNGTYTSLLRHYAAVGAAAGNVASLYYNDAAYRAAYPEVDAGVIDHTYPSGIWEFAALGAHAGRTGSPAFDPSYYASTYDDAAPAVASGAYDSLLEHYLIVGLPLGRAAHA